MRPVACGYNLDFNFSALNAILPTVKSVFLCLKFDFFALLLLDKVESAALKFNPMC